MNFLLERVKIFVKIYPYFKPYRHLYLGLSAIKFGLLILSIITPFLYMLLINDVMIEGNLIMLVLIIAGYTVVFLIQTLMTALNKCIYNKIFIKFNLKLRMAIISKFGNMENELYEEYSSGDIKNRIEGDAATFEKFFINHVINFIFAIISAIVITVIMLKINYILAGFSLVMVPFSFVFAKFMSKKARKVSDDYRENYGVYESYLHLTFQNWKEIKSNNLQENEILNLASYWKTLSKLFVKKQIYWFINRGFIAFKDLFITKMNIYFLGGILIVFGKLEVALLLMFMEYYEQFFSYISSISDSIVDFKIDMPSIERVLSVLDYDEPVKQTFDDDIKEIKFEDVYFSYPNNNRTVLKGINLLIRKKEYTAVVGKSGCGKTTLIKLILGLYKPTRGRILLNGTDYKSLKLKRKIGVIMQEPIFFNLSIKENLKIAKRTASNAEIDYVCQKTNIYDFIQKLPEKYNTIIGERGVKLSGGQRQRLALARTLLYNPEIIIFDEATSALDSENEKAIMSAMRHLVKESTVISISHRLSSILDANRVFIIDDGQIVANGTHSELKNADKTYDLLFSEQYGAEVQKCELHNC